MADRRGFIKGLFITAAGTMTMVSLPPNNMASFHEERELIPADMNDPEVNVIFEAMWEALDGRTTHSQLSAKFREIMSRKDKEAVYGRMSSIVDNTEV